MNENENTKFDFLELWLIILSIFSGFGIMIAVNLIFEFESFIMLIVIVLLIGGNILAWKLKRKGRKRYSLVLSLVLALISVLPVVFLFLIAFVLAMGE